MILFAGPEIEVVSQPDKVCALVPDALCHVSRDVGVPSLTFSSWVYRSSSTKKECSAGERGVVRLRSSPGAITKPKVVIFLLAR